MSEGWLTHVHRMRYLSVSSGGRTSLFKKLLILMKGIKGDLCLYLPETSVRTEYGPTESRWVPSPLLSGEYCEPSKFRTIGGGVHLKLGPLNFGRDGVYSSSNPTRCSSSQVWGFRELLQNDKNLIMRQAPSRHLNKQAADATTSAASMRTQSRKRPKFGLKGRTPGSVPKTSDARDNGRYAWQFNELHEFSCLNETYNRDESEDLNVMSTLLLEEW
jgi:hypothetical protein